MKTPDWRSPEAYAGVAHLPMCDIAWEFLRRNQSYRAAFRKSQNEECVRDKSLINYWELGLMADPDLSARDADICWRYERCASVIILSNMLRGSSYPCLNLSDVRGQIIRKSAEDGTHLIVRDKNYCFQLFLLATADLGDALQANIPFDDIAGTRCEAVNRFYRFLIGETPAKMPRRCGMRAKYPHALQALDGCIAGATYREIAEVLFGAARIEQESWKTSTLRSSTIRLVKLAEDLMRGGYKELLLSNSY